MNVLGEKNVNRWDSFRTGRTESGFSDAVSPDYGIDRTAPAASSANLCCFLSPGRPIVCTVDEPLGMLGFECY